MPAEITSRDAFGQAITHTIRSFGFESVLEIGSFDGLGSTQVFIESLRHAGNPRMTCLESCPTRYRQLLVNTMAHEWVRCICQSSLSIASLTPKDFDRDVWESPYNALRYPRDLVREWWDTTQRYLAGVQSGFLETLGDTFDVALVDGDEFCGYDDFRLVKDRVRCLMLDDVFHAYKCHRAHHELTQDDAWRLVWADSTVRNGASIWVRK